MGASTFWLMWVRGVVLGAALLLLARPAAADGQNAAAEVALALRYERALGVPRDYGRALGLYCDAARHGSAEAALDIGWMFLTAHGVARDTVAGTAWLRLAARRGNVQASHLLELLAGMPAGVAGGCPGPPKTTARTTPPPAIAGLVAEIGAEYKVDPGLLSAVIATESAFHADAVSPHRARGLMQLTDETARRFGVRDVFEPADNIRGGARYLRWLLARFDGNLSLALAGYNAGETAVARYGSVPPYAETRAYVERILSLYPAPR